MKTHPFSIRIASLAALTLFATMLGCGGSETVSPDAAAAQALAAERVFGQMRAAYREAQTYTDRASLIEHAVSRETGSATEAIHARMSVAFTRPNKLHIYFEELGADSEATYRIASDGVRVRSTTGHLPGQIHEAIAPRTLTAENLVPEPNIRGELFAVSLENVFPQLAMLLSEDSEDNVAPIFSDDTKSRLLDDAPIDGAPCYRIQSRHPAGARVLWIDKKNFLLRRMELPIDSQRAKIDPEGEYSELSIWIDFTRPTVNQPISDEAFAMAVPEGARRVRRLVPPPPAGPDDRLGEPTDDFVFAIPGGGAVSRDSLAGKVVVLDFWSTICPPCQAQTPVLEQVYQQFRQAEGITFFAVSVDASRVSDETVVRTLKKWGSTIPVARDLQHAGYRKLYVTATPTLLLLDRHGRFQAIEQGAHQDAQPIIAKIQKLLDGGSLADDADADHQRRLEQHEAELESVTIRDATLDVEIETKAAEAQLPKQKLPKAVRLSQLWRTDTAVVSRPGDLLVVDDHSDDDRDAQPSRIFVFDGGQAIVEVDLVGNLVARHELPEHEGQANGFLRSTIASDGRRWVLASGVGWQKVFLFDENWATTLTFPDEPHSGIADALFATSDAEPPTMTLGYWGGLGAQGVSLDGHRRWSNRQPDHVLQLAPGKADVDGEMTTWCTTVRGSVMLLSGKGKTINEFYVAGRSLVCVAVGIEGDNFCGISIDDFGQYSAIGLDIHGARLWQYDLPSGETDAQFPRLESVRLPRFGDCWQVVAANGSIHWIAQSGERIDHFDYGQPITGLKTTQIDDQTLLLVATENELTAWSVGAGKEPNK